VATKILDRADCGLSRRNSGCFGRADPDCGGNILFGLVRRKVVRRFDRPQIPVASDWGHQFKVSGGAILPHLGDAADWRNSASGRLADRC